MPKAQKLIFPLFSFSAHGCLSGVNRIMCETYGLLAIVSMIPYFALKSHIDLFEGGNHTIIIPWIFWALIFSPRSWLYACAEEIRKSISDLRLWESVSICESSQLASYRQFNFSLWPCANANAFPYRCLCLWIENGYEKPTWPFWNSVLP